MRLLVLAAVALSVLPTATLAECPIGTSPAAEMVGGFINAQNGDAQTYCVAHSEQTSCSAICFTASRVTASFQDMTHWLLAGNGAIRELTVQRRLPFDYLYMTDRGLLAQDLALRLPTTRALEAQSQTPSGYGAIDRSLSDAWMNFRLEPLPRFWASSVVESPHRSWQSSQ